MVKLTRRTCKGEGGEFCPIIDNEKSVRHASIGLSNDALRVDSCLATRSPLPRPAVRRRHFPFAASYVKELVGSKPLVVFSKSYCPYCTKAKTALKAVGAKYEVSPKSEKRLLVHTLHMVMAHSMSSPFAEKPLVISTSSAGHYQLLLTRPSLLSSKGITYFSVWFLFFFFW